MSGWVSPSDHARAFYESEGDAIPHIPNPEVKRSPYDEHGAFQHTITEATRKITEWIDGEVERGATDALVAALRQKGWAVIEPADATALIADTRDAEDWARYPARRTAELLYRIRRTLQGKR